MFDCRSGKGEKIDPPGQTLYPTKGAPLTGPLKAALADALEQGKGGLGRGGLRPKGLCTKNSTMRFDFTANNFSNAPI